MPDVSLSIVIPLYNEEDIVEELVERTAKAARMTGEPFEIVVVNDGSADGTLPALVALGRKMPELRVIDLLRNFGHMPALSAGIAAARGQAVLAMDGDLQDPPEMIPRFVDEWKSGADVVYGLRTGRKEPFLKRAAIGLFYWTLTKITDTKIPSQAGTFGLMDRKVADVFNALPERHRYFAGLRAWAGGKVAHVDYERPDRGNGPSRVGGMGLFRLGRDAVISFSKVPLRYASLFSLACGLVMFIVGAVAILIRIFTPLAIPGWATYTTLVGMMGFVQSVVLAILSEYVAVIFDEVKARPLYVVREEFARGEAVRK